MPVIDALRNTRIGPQPSRVRLPLERGPYTPFLSRAGPLHTLRYPAAGRLPIVTPLRAFGTPAPWPPLSRPPKTGRVLSATYPRLCSVGRAAAVSHSRYLWSRRSGQPRPLPSPSAAHKRAVNLCPLTSAPVEHGSHSAVNTFTDLPGDWEVAYWGSLVALQRRAPTG